MATARQPTASQAHKKPEIAGKWKDGKMVGSSLWYSPHCSKMGGPIVNNNKNTMEI
jgi:hypothetical protein